MMKYLLPLGIILILIGILLIFIASFTTEKNNVKAAGGIFIGPIPIFGAFTDKKMLYILFTLALILFIIFNLIKKW